MLSQIIRYFIPRYIQSEEELRQYRLIVQILLITAGFDLSYAMLTVHISMTEGTYVMLIAFLIHGSLSFFVKRGVSILLITHLYLLCGAQAVFQCTYYSGGFNSPVLPWFGASPIIALLMGGRRTGIIWVFINVGCVLTFAILELYHYPFPFNYDPSWKTIFSVQCYAGLVLIMFVASLVFEDEKNKAFKKLAEQNVLLAEEKKKVAVQQISQEIHDNIGQTLSLAKLNLHTLQRLSDDKPKTKIDDTVVLLSKAIKDLREISNNLHSDNITDFNVVEAITNETSMIAKIGNYKIDIHVEGNYKRLSPQTEFILYRMYQEVINNIIKHAKASSIIISVHYSEERLILKIKDNGIGMSCEDVLLNGQGIRNIRSRAKLIGGEVVFDSAEDKGTTVHISLPVELPVH